MKTARPLALLFALLTLSPALAPLAQASEAVVLDPDAPRPYAFFLMTPGEGATGTPFVLDLAGSHLPNGTDVLVHWGDGNWSRGRHVEGNLTWEPGVPTANATRPLHWFPRPGDYRVVLTLTNGGASSAAQAWVRVTAYDPPAATRDGNDPAADHGIVPNNALILEQVVGFNRPHVGVLVALVAGLHAEALPLNTTLGSLNLTYLSCSPAGCVPADLANATDPDGESTAGLSIILQKVLNATFVALDVADEHGRVHAANLTAALRHAATLGPQVVVSLLPPEAGFGEPAPAAHAADPQNATATHDAAPPLDRSDQILFWRALLANRAQYDYNATAHPHPLPRNHTLPHVDAYGVAHEEDAACPPRPMAGPRWSAEDNPGIPAYQNWTNSTKLADALHAADRSHLSPAELSSLDRLLGHLLDRLCVQEAVDELEDQGVLVVVPAGDNARHGTLSGEGPWDLQTVRGLAELPQVLTVGATTSTTAPDGAPHYGTRRVILPSSAAGPTRSLYGVKPDLVAPGDVATTLLPHLSEDGAFPAQRYHLVEDFARQPSGALINESSRVTFDGGEMKVQGASGPEAGILFGGVRPMPAQPLVKVDFRVKSVPGTLAGTTGISRTQFVLGVHDGTSGWVPRDGFGVNVTTTTTGQLQLVTHVWTATGAEQKIPDTYQTDYEIDPDPSSSGDYCLVWEWHWTCFVREPEPEGTLVVPAKNCPAPDCNMLVPADTDLRLIIQDIATPTSKDRVYQFKVTDPSETTVHGVVQRIVLARSSTDKRVCLCDAASAFAMDRPTGAASTHGEFDNLVATGLTVPVSAGYGDALPLEAFPGFVGVRPSTRLAAAYAAGVALAMLPELSPALDAAGRLAALRQRILDNVVPLTGVPPSVQGVGQLRADLMTPPGALPPLAGDVHPATPSLDFGIQASRGSEVSVTFNLTGATAAVGESVHFDTARAKWHRVNDDLTLAVIDPLAMGLKANQTSQSNGAYNASLLVDQLPAFPGVYVGYVPALVGTRLDGTVVPSLFFNPRPVPVLLTRAADLTVRLAPLGVPPGATAWLLPAENASGQRLLTYQPVPGMPSDQATTGADSAAPFGATAPARYALALAEPMSLPVASDLGPGGVRDAGRARGVSLVAPDVNATTAASLPPGGDVGRAVPVAYRFLDVRQGKEFQAMNVKVPHGTSQGALSPREYPVGAWDLRGDVPLGHGRALAEALPVGETPYGWDFVPLGHAAPRGLGALSAEAARAAHLAFAREPAAASTSLAGHLDPRPYLVEGDAKLPWARLNASFDLPLPLEEAHGVLVLPLELDGATAWVRIGVPGRELTYLVTPRGVVHYAAPDGLAWPHKEDPYDRLPDHTAGGMLSGAGHTHLLGASPRLVTSPPTPAGYLVPFAFHDLTDASARLDVHVLVRPDPLSATPLGAGPLDHVEGPRFRLDPVSVYAWTRGEARATAAEITGLDARATGRFDVDGDRDPALLGKPFDATAPLHPEFIELYLRAPPAALTVSPLAGQPGMPVGVGPSVRLSDKPIRDNHTLRHPYGAKLAPAARADAAPGGADDPYGQAPGAVPPVVPVDIRFASNASGLWRVSTEALAAASGGTGKVRILLGTEPAAATPLPPLAEPVPDFADPTAPLPRPYDCVAPLGLGDAGVAFVAIPLGRLLCSGILRELLAHRRAVEGELGLLSAAPPSTDAGESTTTADASGADATATTSDASSGNETANATAACTPALSSTGLCLGDPLDYVEDEAGAWARFLTEILDLLLRGRADEARDPRVLWEGVVPPPGALLTLRHRLTPLENATDPRGALLLDLPDEGVTHRLSTLEGVDRFTPDDPAARAAGERLEVFDLTGFGGLHVRLRIAPENASWNVSAWRLLPRTPGLPEAPHDHPHLGDPASSWPAPALDAVPPHARPAALGPREQARLANDSAAAFALPRGLVVTGDLAVRGKALLVGGTGQLADSEIIRVAPGARLVLDDVVVAPRLPRGSWGIVVEPGATLVVNGSTLFRGGAGESGLATVRLKGGAAFFDDARLVAGGVGVRAEAGSLVHLNRTTLARFAKAVDARDAEVHLHDAFLDANALGAVAANATLRVAGGVYASNRDAALLVQDSLVAVSGATFLWNGEAGPRAALVALEGVDNGRVVLHDARFLANGRAVEARADVDVHGGRVRQEGGAAFRVAPNATLRLAHVDVDVQGAAFHVGAGASLEARNLTVAAATALDCAASGAPRGILLDNTTYAGALDAACGAAAPSAPAQPASPSWRHVAARPFLRAEGNPYLVLPDGADARLHEETPGGRVEIPLGADGTFAVGGDDRRMRLVASDAAGQVAPEAWADQPLRDATPPGPGLALAQELVLGFTARRSVPVRLDPGESGSGMATASVTLDTRRADGRPGLRDVAALSGARGANLVVGRGALGEFGWLSGERLELEPRVLDRAGNAAAGSVASVSLDATAPRVWLHAANPCGDLVGHDLHWRAHDPRVGVDLPAPPATTYVVSAMVLNLTWVLNYTGLDRYNWSNVSRPDYNKQFLEQEIQDRLRHAAGAADLHGLGRSLQEFLRRPDPQALNALFLKEIEKRLEEIVEGPHAANASRLLWVELGRFDRDREHLYFSGLDNLTGFLERNLPIEDVLNRTWANQSVTEEAILAYAAQMRAAVGNLTIDDAISTGESVQTVLERILNDPHGTAGSTVGEKIRQVLENLTNLHPIVLTFRVDAYDALGNKATAYVPVIADSFAPEALLYFLGDHLRERAVALLLGASANVDLNDLHGSISVFDPDCGLRHLDVLERVVNETGVQVGERHLVRLHPRHGRVDFDLGAVQGLFRPDECGLRNLSFYATDVFGKDLRFNGSTLLDRLEPETLLEPWRREALGLTMPLATGFEPPASTGWLGLDAMRIAGTSSSRNLPGCEDIMSAIHNVTVLARLEAQPWIELVSKHYGGVWNGSATSNSTVAFNESVRIDGARLGHNESEVDGRVVTVKVVASDESGNQENATNATFSFTLDRSPPFCSLDEVGQTGGFVVPVRWNASDANQSVEGEVAKVGLVYRPADGSAGWHLAANLSGPQGAADAVLGQFPWPPWLSLTQPNLVHFACAVYDAAGNGNLSAPVEKVLDLDVPLIDWLGVPALHSNGTFVLNWTIRTTSSSLSSVVAYAGRVGEDHRASATFGNNDTGGWELSPSLLAGEDGHEWYVRVEATTNTSSTANRTHRFLVDLTAPAGDLFDLADDLLEGDLLPVPLREFYVNLTNQSPAGRPSAAQAWLTARDAAGNLTRIDALPGSQAFRLDVDDGAHDVTLHVCDEAGNCQEPAPNLTVRADRTSPTALLENLTGVLLTTPLGAGTVSWLSTSAVLRFRVDDPEIETVASGPVGLTVLARPLRPDGAPSGAQPATLSAVDVTPNGSASRVYEVRFENGSRPFAPNVLHRLEVVPLDLAGNAPSAPVPVEGGLVAIDAEGPFATLQAPAPFVRGLAVTLAGTVQDTLGEVNTGVAGYRVVATRPDGSTWTSDLLAPGADGAYVTTYALGLSDEGAPVRFCVRAQDLAGNEGRCSASHGVLLDLTPPGVTVTPPLDASTLDPTTRLLPLRVGLTVANNAQPGREASPVTRVLVEVESTDRLAAAVHAIDVPAAAQAIPAGGTWTTTLDLDVSGSNLAGVRAYALDAAGNAPARGSADPARPNRLLTESALWPFDARDGLQDRSGAGAHLSSTSALVAGRHGSAAHFDGNDYAETTLSLPSAARLTAMAWVNLTAAVSTGTAKGAPLLTKVHGSEAKDEDWNVWVNPSHQPTALVKTTAGTATLTSNRSLTVGQWHHVALTYDGAFARLHVDGVESARASLTGAVRDDRKELHLGGAVSGGLWRYLRAHLDEVRILRDALAPETIADLAALPYEGDVAPLDLHLDVEAPLALPVPLDLIGSLPARYQDEAALRTFVMHPGQVPTGLDAVQLEARTLDGSAYARGPVEQEGHVSFAQQASSLGGNTGVALARAIALPADVASVLVEAEVSDNIALTHVPCGTLGTHDIRNKLVYELSLGAATGRWDVTAEGTDPVRRNLTASAAGATELAFRVKTQPYQTWETCYPKFEVRLHHLRVLDAATGETLFSEPVRSTEDVMAAWQASGHTAHVRVAQAAWTPAWTAAPSLLYAATWPTTSLESWTLRDEQDALTLLETENGPVDGKALRLRHASTTSLLSTLRPLERAGLATGTLDASTLLASAKVTRVLTGGATLDLRAGIQVDLEGDHSLVFYLHNHGFAPPPASEQVDGRTLHYVDATAGVDVGQWEHLSLDLAAAKALLGLADKKVVGVNAYLKKNGTASATSSFEGAISLDDVQLLAHPRTRVDLPFAFPFYGRAYTTLWADEDGVVGFRPDFDDAPTDANFRGEPLLAPAWGHWTRRGTGPAGAHGVSIDLSDPEQATLVWQVGPETNPASDDAFALTLTRQGEVLVRYGAAFPDVHAVRIIGVSAGDGRFVQVPVPGSLAGRSEGFLPGAGAWQPLATTHPRTAGLPTDVLLAVRASATDRAGNADPVARTEPDALHAYSFDAGADGFSSTLSGYYGEAVYDASQRRIRLVAEHRDWSNEIITRSLPAALDASRPFTLTARWAADVKGVNQVADPLFLSASTSYGGYDQRNFAGIRYQSGGANQDPTYTLLYRDNAGATRIAHSFTGAQGAEYLLRIDYEPAGRLLTLRVQTPAGAHVASASYALGQAADDFFRFTTLGAGVRATGSGNWDPRTTGWVDDVRLGLPGEGTVELAPELLVHVDTRPPVLNLTAWRDAAGMLVVRTRLDDRGAGVDAATVRLEVRALGATDWTLLPVEVPVGEDVEIATGHALAAGEHEVRLSAADRIGHAAAATTTA